MDCFYHYKDMSGSGNTLACFNPGALWNLSIMKWHFCYYQTFESNANKLRLDQP